MFLAGSLLMLFKYMDELVTIEFIVKIYIRMNWLNKHIIILYLESSLEDLNEG